MFMKPNDSHAAGLRSISFKFIFPFLVFSFFWIFTSEYILRYLVTYHLDISYFLILRVTHLIVTTILLYFLFRLATKHIRQSEARYRHLFENAGVSIWQEDFSRVKEYFDEKQGMGVVDWQEYFDRNPKEVLYCASLVRVIDINRQTLELLEVDNEQEFPESLEHFFTEYSIDAFKQELVALAGGAQKWFGEIPVRSFKGKSMRHLFQLSVVPGYEKDLSKVIVSTIDITQRKHFEAKVKINEMRLRQIIDLVPHFIFAKDIDGRFILVNEAVAKAYGTTVDNLIGKTDADFAKSQDEVRHFREDDMDVIRLGEPKVIPQETITNAQGQRRYLSTTKIPFMASGVQSPCILGVAVDITDFRNSQEALMQSRHFIDSILNATPDLIYIYDLINKRSVYCNRGALEFLGYESQQTSEMMGDLFKEIIHPDDCIKLAQHHQQLIKEGEIRQIDYRIKDGHGQWRWLRSREVLFARTADGHPWQILGTAEDITDRKHLEIRLLSLAHYDILTSFPNRALFYERASVGLSHAKRSKTSCAILFVDLDYFKSVNDSLGHSVGDELIKDTAVKLSECIREMDTIARLGGDEFIIFLNSLEDPQSVGQIAQRIRDKFNAPRQIMGNDLYVTASVGIATYPNDAKNLEELLKKADLAMYAAKKAGRNGFCFFDSAMNTRAINRIQIESGLREALSNTQLRLHYQPIISVKDNRLRGFEALLRWQKADGSFVAPGEFIDIAEETGLIISIGQWVLKEACGFAKKLVDLGHKDIVMSVNISVAQLKRKSILESIAQALQESGLPASSLEIEITESICIDSFDFLIETLKEIHAMGVSISLDDFGTGYSSLSHLHRLPINNLKIDRLFIQEMAQKDSKGFMAQAMIDMAHTLNLRVVAEGVECDSQLQQLVDKQCDYFQGFLTSRPMPEENAINFVLSQQ